jgi:hypothetical protein
VAATVSVENSLATACPVPPESCKHFTGAGLPSEMAPKLEAGFHVSSSEPFAVARCCRSDPAELPCFGNRWRNKAVPWQGLDNCQT